MKKYRLLKIGLPYLIIVSISILATFLNNNILLNNVKDEDALSLLKEKQVQDIFISALEFIIFLLPIPIIIKILEKKQYILNKYVLIGAVLLTAANFFIAELSFYNWYFVRNVMLFKKIYLNFDPTLLILLSLSVVYLLLLTECLRFFLLKLNIITKK
jgi:hypothetical protein